MQVTRIEQKEAEKAKIRVAAYCRVSTDKDEQEESLENQMQTFRYRIALHNDWELVGIYADDGLSGTSVKKRVRFQEMIRDCEEGNIDRILTKSISRFARNTLDCIQYVRKLQGLGVQIYFEKEGIDTSDSTSEMLLSIMASFAQEESRSISENVKWGIRKRFEAGKEVKVPTYGYYHTRQKLFQIRPDEARVVKEIFQRYVQGELPTSILDDMISREVRPPAGDCWKRQQIDRILRNEKYMGDAVLQKTYLENHLTHKQIRNKGEVPMYQVLDAHPAIIDRHTFEQAQKIIGMRKVVNGNCTYPYDEMLKCPHCGKPLMHGSLNNLYYDGRHIQNGGWGCYGEGGCGHYLIIQNILDEAIIGAYEEKYGERKKQVDFYWLDETIETLEPGESMVIIHWRDGQTSVKEMDISEERYYPTRYSFFYNDYLVRVRKGERNTKIKNLMGLNMMIGA